MRNPLVVTFDDLIASTEKRIEWMEKTYPGKVLTNAMSDHVARHNIEVEKVKLKLFRKFKRNPQIDLFKEFESMKK